MPKGKPRPTETVTQSEIDRAARELGISSEDLRRSLKEGDVRIIKDRPPTVITNPEARPDRIEGGKGIQHPGSGGTEKD